MNNRSNVWIISWLSWQMMGLKIFLYIIWYGMWNIHWWTYQSLSNANSSREHVHQYLIPENYTIYHRNGITMDNRLENLLLLSNNMIYLPLKSSSLTSFYWNIVSNLPVDMDEVDYHNSVSHESSLYECHHAPCTQLLSSEQFNCLQCRKIK